MLRFIIKCAVALKAARLATFGIHIADTWYQRYIRHYVYFSLLRPHSFFMLSGADNGRSKWFPSGPKLLSDTGVIKWSRPYGILAPTGVSLAKPSLRHGNPAEGDSEVDVSGMPTLVSSNKVFVEEIDITGNEIIRNVTTVINADGEIQEENLVNNIKDA